MLAQVPSFTIRTPDHERGLGQASENVLVNGQRIANKSGGAVDQLQRTSAASVERIEIVEAASLGIAGLSGQVANIVLKTTKAGSGQFEWDTNARAHFTEPEILGGSISYSNRVGPLDYTISVKNGYGRGGLGGPVKIYDANGVLTELGTRPTSPNMSRRTLSSSSGSTVPGPRSPISRSAIHRTGIRSSRPTPAFSSLAKRERAAIGDRSPATPRTSTAIMNSRSAPDA